VTNTDLDRRATAHRLRRKAQRYRTLAVSNGNAQDVKIIGALSLELDEEASRLEDQIT